MSRVRRSLSTALASRFALVLALITGACGQTTPTTQETCESTLLCLNGGTCYEFYLSTGTELECRCPDGYKDFNCGVEICPLIGSPYPSVTSQYITTDQQNTTVMWNNITTTDDGITYTSDAIICTDSGDGSDVSVTGGIFGVGFHVITCTATNSFGCQRSSNFSFYVYVSDIERPIVTCPTDIITATYPGSPPFFLQWLTIATVTDNSGEALSAVTDSLGPFGVGENTVTYSATDSSGNTGNCTMTVTVKAVVIKCPADIITYADPGFNSTSVNWLEPVLTGWDAPAQFKSTRSSGDTFSVGTTERVDYYALFPSQTVPLRCSFNVTVKGLCDEDDGLISYSWPVTEAGKQADSIEKCSITTEKAGLPKAVRNCSLASEWGEHEVRSCGEPIDKNNITLEDLADVPVSAGNAAEVADFLANITAVKPDEPQQDLNSISAILENIVRAESGEPEVTTAVLETVNNVIINSQRQPSQDSTIDNRRSSSSIVRSVETQVALTLRQEGQVRIRQDTVHVEAISVNVSAVRNGLIFASIQQVTGQPGGQGLLNGSYIKRYADRDKIPSDDTVQASIQLPGSFIDSLQPADGSTNR